MKKLTSDQVKCHEIHDLLRFALLDGLGVAWEKIDNIIGEINNKIEGELSDAIVEYNEILKEATKFFGNLDPEPR